MGLVAAAFWGLPTKAATRDPRIVDGWLPPKIAEAEEFPFIIVRPRLGADTVQGADEDARATVDLIVGVYGDTDDAWHDVLLVIDAIRQSLGAGPVLEGTAFEQVGPLAWVLPEDQPRPQWFGTVTTVWSLPRSARVEARNPEA
jgi:hypothetical protein